MASPVVVFDVNETLSDLTPIAETFTAVGAAPHLAEVWFATLLRDGFAATVTGDLVPFAELGRERARELLDATVSSAGGNLDAAVGQVMSAFSALSLHADVVPGVRTLAEAGVRLVTLSNGAAGVAEGLLVRAGIRDAFEHVLTVEDAGIWKPATGAYRYAARVCDASPQDMLMVAVHPWDLHGAATAGLGTAWIDRAGTSAAPRRYPGYFLGPDHVVRGVDGLPDVLGTST